MKRFGLVLALLVLLSIIGETGTVRADTTTGYYVDVRANIDTVETVLNSTSWSAYTPNIVSIVPDSNTTRIYFESEKDLARFLMPPDFGDNPVFPLDKVSASLPVRVLRVAWGSPGSGTRDVAEVTFTDPVVTYIGATIVNSGGGTADWVKVSSVLDLNCGGDPHAFVKTTGYDYRISMGDESGDGHYPGYSVWFVIEGSDYSFQWLYSFSDSQVHFTQEYTLNLAKNRVFFFFKDILTGQPLQGVTVSENGQVLGTLDDGGTLELPVGTHTLTFEKSGYWSVTKTVDVQNDMSVSVEMYPSSAAFKLENFPVNISIPENTIYTLTFTLSPIDKSATYNTYLAISGLTPLEVRKDGQTISPESGKYYLGDISGPTQVSIKFKAGSAGTHGFTLTLTSNDAIMSKTYTTTKQVIYQVEPLPFSVQMPSEWQVGTNELRISESSGQSYLITAVLKDSQGNEVWSDSHAFSPYEAHTFQINVPAEGSYTLELQWNGQTAVYDITVNPAITLVTKTLTVQKGGEGIITLHFKNPSSSVQYYTIKVSGGFLPAEINQSISVAPLTEKDVSIAFAVPDNLQYDAYELNVQVLQGNATVFSDKVAVTISDDSGFSLFGGVSSEGKTLYYGLAALVGLGLFVAILRRR